MEGEEGRRLGGRHYCESGEYDRWKLEFNGTYFPQPQATLNPSRSAVEASNQELGECESEQHAICRFSIMCSELNLEQI